MDKHLTSNNRSRMQEAPPAPTAPTRIGLLHKAVWTLMLLLPLAGITFSALAIKHAQKEVMLSKMQSTYAAMFNINGNLSPDLRGVYAQVIPAEHEVYRTFFNKPEAPWLKTAVVIFAFALIINLQLLHLTIRRKYSAMKVQKIAAILMIAGGTILFAGTNSQFSESNLPIFVIAYPAIAYLAYTRWERVRAQLYRD